MPDPPPPPSSGLKLIGALFKLVYISNSTEQIVKPRVSSKGLNKMVREGAQNFEASRSSKYYKP